MAGDILWNMINSRSGSPSDYVDLVFGQVISISPLKVQMGDTLVLPAELLTLGERVTKHMIKLNGADVEIDGSLKVNDRVVMIRMDGGQTFYILERGRTGNG